MLDKKEPRWDPFRDAWMIDTDAGPVLADPQPLPPEVTFAWMPGEGVRTSRKMIGDILGVPPAAKLTL